MFKSSMPSSEFPVINEVSDSKIPDVAMNADGAAQIYDFYRAGILVGSDTLGTFNPDSNIVRSEVAAILTRIFDNTARKTITLNNYQVKGGYDECDNVHIRLRTFRK